MIPAGMPANKKLSYIDIRKACEDHGKRIGRDKCIHGAHSHEWTETHVLAVAPFQHVGKQDGAKEGACCNRGAAQRTDDDAHDNRQDRESAPEVAEPFIKHIHCIKPEA